VAPQVAGRERSLLVRVLDPRAGGEGQRERRAGIRSA
jgi:hypothetical protein